MLIFMLPKVQMADHEIKRGGGQCVVIGGADGLLQTEGPLPRLREDYEQPVLV